VQCNRNRGPTPETARLASPLDALHEPVEGLAGRGVERHPLWQPQAWDADQHEPEQVRMGKRVGPAESTRFNPASLVRLLGARRMGALLFGRRDARHHPVDVPVAEP